MASCECEYEGRVYVTRSNGKQPRMGKRPNTAKPKEDPNFIEFPSVEKLSLGNDPNLAKTQEDTGSRKGVKPRTMEEVWEILEWFDHVNGIGRPSPSERNTIERIPKPTSMRFSGKPSHAGKPKEHPKFPEKFAIAALSYLRKEGHNLKPVEACSYEKKGIKRGYRVHINFKARRIDEPSAPVETYFAQLVDCVGNSIIVECCVSFGRI